MLPHRYLELYEKGEKTLKLDQSWPAVFYDEDLIESDDELSGLFKGETLVRVTPPVITLSRSLTGSLSVASAFSSVRRRGKNGFIPSQIPDRTAQATKKGMRKSTISNRSRHK